MSITLHWDNDDQTIIRQVHDGKWTWAEVSAAWEEGLRMGESVSHAVDFIIDLRASGLLPQDAIRNARRIGTFRTVSQENLTVIVGANLYIRTFWDTLNKVYSGKAFQRLHVAFAATLEEARGMIAQFHAEKR